MIHPSAIIDPAAELAADVQVGPWTIIGPDVKIGAGTVIGPHVVLQGPSTIGRNNRIFQFASVGEACQASNYKGEPTALEVGDNNIIREHVTIHRGTPGGSALTRIGDDNLLMVGVHIAHDCIIGNGNTFANTTGLAGHVHIGDGVIFGGMTGIHQFCQIGSYAMTAGCTLVLKDVPAYLMVAGNPAGAHGMNYRGMQRRGWSKETIQVLRRAYRTVYRQGLTLQQAIEVLDPQVDDCPELGRFVESLRGSQRGITR